MILATPLCTEVAVDQLLHRLVPITVGTGTLLLTPANQVHLVRRHIQPAIIGTSLKANPGLYVIRLWITALMILLAAHQISTIGKTVVVAALRKRQSLSTRPVTVLR